ncbi:MAG: DNA-binding protein, partial [Halobacteria archaeon]|nr:DNA-binding protein [Halobacteria archaeon]
IGSDSEYWKARVVDPTGTFLVYAGQYQPEAVDVIRDIEPPAYVAVVGKPDTYDPEPEDDTSDIITSIRPESVTVVDDDTRDLWIKETAERTMERIEGNDGDMKQKARDVYGANDERYRDVVVEALENLE